MPRTRIYSDEERAERIKESKRRWRLRNVELLREVKRRYNANNRERVNGHAKRYCYNHREEALAIKKMKYHNRVALLKTGCAEAM
jgi:hypothetical protein